MSRYIVKATSKISLSITFVASLSFSILFVGYITYLSKLKPDKIIFIIICIIITLLVFKVLRSILTFSYKIVLEKDHLEIERRYYRAKKNKIYFIYFRDIERYLYQEDQYLNNFRIYLYNGKKIKITMYNDIKKSNNEFEIFYLQFENYIKNYNLKNTEREIMIKPTLYQSRFGLFISYFLILIMIIIPVLIIIFDKKINIGNIIFLYSSSFYFIYRVYHDRKND